MKNFNFAKYFQIYYHVDDTSGLNRLFQKKKLLSRLLWCPQSSKTFQ